MLSIFEKLFFLLQEDDMIGFTLVRSTIREDEDFGEAIIERPDGTPQTWSWDAEKKEWN